MTNQSSLTPVLCQDLMLGEVHLGIIYDNSHSFLCGEAQDLCADAVLSVHKSTIRSAASGLFRNTVSEHKRQRASPWNSA